MHRLNLGTVTMSINGHICSIAKLRSALHTGVILPQKQVLSVNGVSVCDVTRHISPH